MSGKAPLIDIESIPALPVTALSAHQIRQIADQLYLIAAALDADASQHIKPLPIPSTFLFGKVKKKAKNSFANGGK